MVNIAQIKVARPPEILCALGLGSCVGVVLFDPVNHVCGMLHVLLPASREGDRSTKYVDSGLSKLREEVIRAGASGSRLRAKLAGGAEVLMPAGGSVIPVGRQNGSECLRILSEMGISVEGKDLGGTSGRSVYFETETCIMRIKKLVGGECQL